MSELYAVDVSVDFIETVASHVEDRLKADRRVTVLFPNRRAVRFFEKRLASPLLLRLTVAALEDYARDTVYALSEPPPHFQLDIDRAFTLYDILSAHPALFHRLGGKMEFVFPWCIHLSNLFDEFDQHLIPSVAPLPYIDSVIKEARDILENLNALYRDYRRIVTEQNLTYHGDIFRRLEALKERLTGPFVLAGFSLLTESQKSLFQHLFHHGDTTIFFHTDLERRHPVADPYRLYENWMNGTFWGVKPREIRAPSPSAAPREITFHESFDTHSEASQVANILNETLRETGPVRAPLQVGIVLPDSQVLFPLLYTLVPRQYPMNVTLGFPFERSTFNRFLESLIELILTQHPQRGFYHAPLLRFLAHPFIRFMKIGTAFFEKTAKRLQEMILSENLAFVQLEDLDRSPVLTGPARQEVRWLNEEILRPFATATALKQMGNVLKKLLRSFREALSTDPAFELERQMAQNFMDRVLSNLILSRSADRNLASPKVLCHLLRHLTAPLHLPFEGDPLQGLQIMGVLESRLLNFHHLFILDVNEGILPKSLKIDPLLPPSLHPLVGLPSLKTRDDLFRYYFFRLVDSARKVHIFYQKGITGDEKRIRSRYVEQLLMEEELKRKAMDRPVEEMETTLIQRYTFSIPPPTFPETKPPGFYAEKLEECLRKRVSPTFLDTYLECPHRFYLRFILKMTEEKGIEERQSPLDVGNMVHQLLENAFKEACGHPLTRERVQNIRDRTLQAIDPAIRKVFSTLSPLRRDLLRHLTHHRLGAFFRHLEEEVIGLHRIRILNTEKPLAFDLKGIPLSGRIDRMDEILETPDAPARWRIIDYKTGSSAKSPTQNLSAFLDSFDFSDTSLQALSELKGALSSIQLPLYLYLVEKTMPFVRQNRLEAVLYFLGSPGGQPMPPPFLGNILSPGRIESLVLYLIRHMRRADTLAPHDMSDCPSCAYVNVCKLTTRSQRRG